MIEFKCKCGKKFSVDDKYAGKKGKCPKCKEVVIVPQPDNTDIVDDIINDFCKEPHRRSNTIPEKFPKPTSNPSARIYASTNEHQQLEASFGMPTWIWYLYGATAVIIISVILYIFVFRDTWEIDHYGELSTLMNDAGRLYNAKEYQAGLKKYDELTTLLGDRKLKRDDLRSSYTEMQGTYIPLKKKIRVEETEIARKRQAEKERKLQAEAEKQREEENRRLEILEKERAEEEKIRARANQFVNNPTESYQEFCSDYMSNISKYKFYPDYSVYSKYQMNLQKTGNMLRPVIGTLNFHVEKYDSYFKKILLFHEYRLTFAPDDGKWTLVSAENITPTIEHLGFRKIESGSKDWKIIMRAYNETPNP